MNSGKFETRRKIGFIGRDDPCEMPIAAQVNSVTELLLYSYGQHRLVFFLVTVLAWAF